MGQQGSFTSRKSLGESDEKTFDFLKKEKKKRDGFARPKPMPFKRQIFEVEGQTAAVVGIDRALPVLIALFQLCEVSRWRWAFLRANAKILSGETVPGHGAFVFLRLLSGNRHLAVCGS